MCTSIAMKTSGFYFGRTMDIEFEFGERVVITPRGYPFHFRRAGCLSRHYAIIGMASVEDGYPLYADAVNEKGLCMAGLKFPDTAYYPMREGLGRANVSPFELIPWVLGRCATVEEARQQLSSLHILGIPFSDSLPLSPLHWHIADSSGSIAVESTREGLKILDDPIGVLTNNPAFSFQMTNLSQYLNLSTGMPNSIFETVGVKPFGNGMGSIGLPGDYSPASRFVKASYLKLNSVCEDSESSSVAQLFHLLDSVSLVRGCVITSEGRENITTYSCCMSADRGVYYYKTYTNNCLCAVDMRRADLNSARLSEFPLEKDQRVEWLN